jgi:hypothetical protein
MGGSEDYDRYYGESSPEALPDPLATRPLE